MNKLFTKSRKTNFLKFNSQKSFHAFKLYKSITFSFTNLNATNGISESAELKIIDDNLQLETVSFYDKKSKEAAELLKVLNTRFDFLNVDNAIRTVLICGHFKNFPRELLTKLEKKLKIIIPEMNEEQLTRTIHGLALLEHSSGAINMAIDKVLGRTLLGFKVNNFIKVIKSFGKNSKFQISQTTFKILKTYIEKNLNVFSLDDACDIFINYPKLLKTIPNSEDSQLYEKLFTQIFAVYEKFDTIKLVNLFNILYSDKSHSLIYESLFKNLNYSYEEKFWNHFDTNENEIDNKLIYLIILTHHFADRNLELNDQLNFETKLNFINNKILQQLENFTPDELNSIITILIKNNKFRKDSKKTNEIFHKFINLINKEYEKMNITELIMYMQSVAMLIEEFKNPNISLNVEELSENMLKDTLFKIENEIMQKVSYMDMLQFASILELIHHFKSKLNITQYFDKIDIDILGENLLRHMSIKTKDNLAEIFEDYYLIFLCLSDLKYSNKKFWTNYMKYIILFQEDEYFRKLKQKNEYYRKKFEKLNILASLVNNMISSKL